MSTVSYKNQPGIQASHGNVGLNGTRHPYTVGDLLWPNDIGQWISKRLIGKTLHVCCGKSKMGDCRVDMFQPEANVRADANALPFAAQSWDTVLIDPPYNGEFQWNHDMLAELARVSRQRIIFQHWFIPVDSNSRFKKSHRFQLSEIAVWQPKTYFGRVQVISVMDCVQTSLFDFNKADMDWALKIHRSSGHPDMKYDGG